MLRLQPTAPIPSDKYFPPQAPPGTTLQRSRLLKLVTASPVPDQFLFLEAQAGQGKTTLAMQLLERLALPFVWYQVGPEDRDPMVFLGCLLHGLQESLAGFASPLLHQLLDGGQAALPDLPQLLQAMGKDLERFLAQGDRPSGGRAAVLVLDDVHILEPSPFSLGVIDTLLETLPDSLVVMLLSRTPVPLQSKRVRFGGRTLYLGNSELAMTRDEGVELLALLLDGLPEPAALNTLLRQAGGWPMGLVLAGQNHAAGAVGLEWRQETAGGYLERELLTTLEPAQRFVVLQLALLDEIPLALAQRIAPDADIASLLNLLVKRNFFLRFLNDEGTLFGFHHLFRSFLQHKAQKTLTEEERGRVYSLAATYSLEQDRPDKAMEYQLRARDFQALETSLERFGQVLIAKGRHLTLHALLAVIPTETIGQSAWFSYFLGAVVQVHDPMTALQAFHQAKTIFHDTGHIKGELLTTSNILYLYIIHSSTLPRAEAVHPDTAHALFEKAGAELPPFCRITTTHQIALGYLYFLNDFEKTRHYNNLTRELAEQSKLPNMLLAARLASGWADNMSGMLDRAIVVVEHNYRLINRKELGFHNRMQLYLFQLDITRTIGGINNYLRQRDEFLSRAGAEAVNNSFAGPWLVLWELELACECGDFPRMRRIFDAHLDSVQFRIAGNFRGELHAWFALYLAVTGREPERIEALLDESRRCLGDGVSPKLFIRIALLLGQVHHLLGQTTEALQLFEQAKSAARQGGMLHMFAWTSLLAALVHHSSGNREEMAQALREGIEILVQKQRYSLMSGFYPEIALRVLGLACEAGIHPEFCRKYAWDILGTDIGGKRMIPLLSIQTLGGFGLALPGGEPWDLSRELSSTQRKFFGLLLAAKSMSVSQLQLQTELWPDIPEKKARARFDTMMTRLRKTLAQVLSPHDVEDYLLVDRGVVSLKRCRVDAVEFRALVDRGLSELHEGGWWQAGNHFTQALILWQGSPAVELLEQSHNEMTDRAVQALISMAQAWWPVLLELGRNEEAMAVCETAWNEDQSNRRLTRELYELKIGSGATAEARRIMDGFAAVARGLGQEQEEVEELVFRITSFEE